MMPDGRPICQLNDYQQLMLKISSLTAYNAVHVIKLKTANRDLSSWQSKLAFAIHELIQTLNLGIPQFSGNLKTVGFQPLEQPFELAVKISTLQEHVNHEMNRMFQAHELPLRFFIISTSKEDYLAMTYNHWISDAYGVSRFLEAVFMHAQGESLPELTLSSPSMKACFPSVYGLKAPIERLFALVHSARRFSMAWRSKITDVEETESASISYIFEPEVLSSMRDYCKREQMTLNDFFVTILAQLFDELTHEERRQSAKKLFKPKRDRITIAVISNIRQHSILTLDTVFSLFLGFFHLSFKTPAQVSFKNLSQTIHTQTVKMKQDKLALKQSLLFKVQNWFWDKKKSRYARYRLFYKNTPITVGISNMDMRHLSDSLKPSLGHYIRFSPTAMVCPIVFNLSSFNTYLSLGINFRKACYTQEIVEGIQARFVMAIDRELSAREKIYL